MTTTVDPDTTETLEPFRHDLFDSDPLTLLGSTCAACSTVTFPQREFCPACRATGSIETVQLPRAGKVHTFTVIRQAPAGIDVPYVLARVELDDGTRLMAQVLTDRPDTVGIGDRLRLVDAVFRPQPGVRRAGFAFVVEGDR